MPYPEPPLLPIRLPYQRRRLREEDSRMLLAFSEHMATYINESMFDFLWTMEEHQQRRFLAADPIRIVIESEYNAMRTTVAIPFPPDPLLYSETYIHRRRDRGPNNEVPGDRFFIPRQPPWPNSSGEYNVPHLDIRLPIPEELVGADDL
jgi:hypothetical protein